jgi:hypothetical protein
VSAQVSEWLSLNQDLALVAASTALDPFAHDDDRHGLLFVNKTGRGDGIRAEAGVIAGPRAGAAYALIVCFDDLSVAHRLRARGLPRPRAGPHGVRVLTPARQTSEDDRVVAVTDDAILRVPQHRAGENLTLDVGAAPGELGG